MKDTELSPLFVMRPVSGMEFRMERVRKTKRETIVAKMEKIDKIINDLQKKTVEYQDQQDKLAQQLKLLDDAEKRAAKEAEQKELLKLIKKSGKTPEEIRKFLEQ